MNDAPLWLWQLTKNCLVLSDQVCFMSETLVNPKCVKDTLQRFNGYERSHSMANKNSNHLK